MAEDKVLSIEEVLAAEADTILGGGSHIADDLSGLLKGKAAQKKRFDLNADDRDSTEVDGNTIEARKKLYRDLNELNRGALCFSGGGIRSATFCLGILQALAHCDATPLMSPAAKPPTVPKGGTSSENMTPESLVPKNSLLGCFHYLSTVSGGGYLGSWLSAWRRRSSFATILSKLVDRPGGPDFEPPEISWLRAYSNYLTPRIGIISADTWAAVAIVVRNMILNWLVIIPVVCLVLLALKFVATASVWAAHGTDPVWTKLGIDTPQLLYGILLLGIVSLVAAQGYTTYHRPARRPLSAQKQKPEMQRGNVPEKNFLAGDLLWALLSAVAVTVFFSSSLAVGMISHIEKAKVMIAAALAGLTIYAIGCAVGSAVAYAKGLRVHHGLADWICWSVSGLVYGACVGLGAILFVWLAPYPPSPDKLWNLLFPIIFGVPWVLTSQLAAENIFVGLSSYEANSDSDREWLGRAAGWLAAAAIAWAIIAFLVFAGGYAVLDAQFALKKYVVASGGVIAVGSGLVTALLGSSSKTPAKSSSDDQGNVSAIASNLVLALAGPIFAAALIIALSIALDALLLRHSLVAILQGNTFCPRSTLLWLTIAGAIALPIGLLASNYVNINRFSLHALYRNRLIRGYLGASRSIRHPDRFTGFDAEDNIRMHELWPADIEPRRLFHVVNIALNVVSTKRLAWQERKAESFTVTPKHCGSAYVGFRHSLDYGGSFEVERSKQGIALGTAMAISGAAVSPNMGYHSSPSIALLLTLFNVRLGWWLGNPGPAGDKHEAYRREGPQFAALPLFFEAFGQTTDHRPYVYLSDGGHFENLGLYEMVRRRCRFIVVVDAGCDPDFTFEDLGNAVRKIYIDLGVRITFDTLQDLQNRPSKEDLRRNAEAKYQIPYHAVGTIHYDVADREGCANGTVVYIKPAYHDTEGAAIRSYAKANATFPHETTTDQWFTESQFESYRALGLDIGKSVLDDPDVQNSLREFLKHD